MVGRHRGSLRAKPTAECGVTRSGGMSESAAKGPRREVVSAAVVGARAGKPLVVSGVAAGASATVLGGAWCLPGRCVVPLADPCATRLENVAFAWWRGEVTRAAGS